MAARGLAGRIRACAPGDAARVCDVYNPYVLESTATFETEPVAAAEMRRRIREVLRGHPWLVYERSGRILAYAYAAPWNRRSAYRHTADCSVYVAQSEQGRGIGTELYRALVDRLAAGAFHTVVGSVALPNGPSVALHEKLGFEKAGELREVGRKFGRWVDVGYWSLRLERRG